MGYTELIDKSATKAEQQSYLVDGETVAITIRIPCNLRDTAKEIATLRGMSFSAYVRMCMIDRITEDATHG